MWNNKIYCFLLLLIVFALSACTKKVPEDMLNKNQTTNQQQMPSDSIHNNLKQQSNEDIGDKKADELMKAADEADAQYQKTKSESDRKICIDKQLAAANYLMFEANLSPKKKYRPALKRYRRVLELDPNNKAAAENKQQIEDIYKSMGMPIPE